MCRTCSPWLFVISAFQSYCAERKPKCSRHGINVLEVTVFFFLSSWLICFGLSGELLRLRVTFVAFFHSSVKTQASRPVVLMKGSAAFLWGGLRGVMLWKCRSYGVIFKYLCENKVWAWTWNLFDLKIWWLKPEIWISFGEMKSVD